MSYRDSYGRDSTNRDEEINQILEEEENPLKDKDILQM
jgi:hypothetical protein